MGRCINSENHLTSGTPQKHCLLYESFLNDKNKFDLCSINKLHGAASFDAVGILFCTNGAVESDRQSHVS